MPFRFHLLDARPHVSSLAGGRLRCGGRLHREGRYGTWMCRVETTSGALVRIGGNAWSLSTTTPSG